MENKSDSPSPSPSLRSPSPPPMKKTSNRSLLSKQKSIRQLPKLEVHEDAAAEALSQCTDNEWDASEEPFSAELLNVKNAPNRISVFSGLCHVSDWNENKKLKKKESVTILSDERAIRLAEMMRKVFEQLIDNRDHSKIKVTIKIQEPSS